MLRIEKICIVGLTLLSVAACSNNKSSSSSQASAAASVAPAQTAVANAAGANVYTSTCSSCHGAAGQGVPGTFPPLAGNPVVTGDAKKLVHIVKYGLSGPTQVAGKTYNGMMPAWGSQLSDTDVAAVVTYVRGAWGNAGGAVTAAEVTAVAK